MTDPSSRPSDEDLAAIVGENMRVVPALDITDKDGRAMTQDAYKAVMSLAHLMQDAGQVLAASEADHAVTLGYDHTARCVYAEVDVMKLMEATLEHMDKRQLTTNTLTNGEATPLARVDSDTGATSIRLFLQGK